MNTLIESVFWLLAAVVLVVVSYLDWRDLDGTEGDELDDYIDEY